MKRARIGIIAAAVLAVATMAFAQKTDFSGTWTLDPEASGMGAGGAGGAGGGGRGGGMAGPMVVKQTADTLTITRTAGETSVTTTYNLTGKEQENTMAGRQGGAPTTAKYVSKWDGAKLVTTITREGANGPTTSTETRSLEGVTMVVESTRTGRDGNPTTQKQVFKKTT